MIRALQAMTFGVRAVGRAPAVILGTYIALLTAIAFPASVLMRTLATSFDNRVLERELPPHADDAWFDRANDVNRPTVGDSFSPAIIGFAIPLSNLADLIDGRQHSVMLAATVTAWVAAWTLLLGGLLHRFAQGTAIGAEAFLRACVRHLLPFSVLALLIFMVYAASVWLSRNAAGRSGPILALLVLVVAAVSVVASYTRACIVLRGVGLGHAVAATLRMIRSAPSMCAAHITLAVAGWALLLAAFAVADWYIGRGGGPWRVVVLSQMYVISRIALRLIWEASTLKLVSAAPE